MSIYIFKFRCDAICIGDISKPLNRCHLWILHMLIGSNLEELDLCKHWIVKIITLLLNLSWIAQILDFTVRNCRNQHFIPIPTDKVSVRLIGCSLVPGGGSGGRRSGGLAVRWSSGSARSGYQDHVKTGWSPSHNLKSDMGFSIDL